MPNAVRSFRHTVRSLLRQPSYSFLVVAMLALGIAGTSAIWSLVHSLLLEPLAFDEPERLVYLNEMAPKWNLELVSIAYADFHTWREENRSFDSLAAVRDASFNLMSDAGPERIRGARVTHDLPRVLRVDPVLGRGFTPEEDRPDARKVTVLSHRLWQGRFGGDPAILGRTLELDGEIHEVVGVLPPGVKYPEDAELWVPMARDPETDYGSYNMEGIGRLLPGVTPALAKEDLDRALVPLVETYAWKEPVSSVVKPLREHYVEDSRRIAWLLMVAVAVVLAIACANVASLMLARSTARGREISVRLALGASRGRLVGQLLGESFVLALSGGVLGVFLGRLGLGTLGTMVADAMPFWVSFEANPKALGTCLAACLLTVLVFGLVPALQTTRVDLQTALSSSEARAGISRGKRRTLAGLVVAEMALAQMLLVGAGLVALSQRQVLRVDPGFRPAGVLTFGLYLPDVKYDSEEAIYGFWTSLIPRLEALPGVLSAAGISNAPLQGHNGNFFEAEGVERGEDEQTPVILTRIASEGYLETMGVPLLAGRDLRVTGTGDDASLEVVVNESFARLHWGEQDPLGRRIRQGDESPWLTVVGVARDVRQYGLDEDPRPGVYLPLGYGTRSFLTLALHTEADPMAFLGPAREVVQEMDSSLPLIRAITMEEQLHRSLVMRRLTAWLFGLFAAVALVLAAGGAYGVLSYGVSQRQRELGVRMALGARGVQVLGDVLRRGMSLAGAGAALGVAGAAALSRWMTAILFGVDARDPGLFAAVVATLAGVALVANAVPAWRAARLDPMRVLREE